MSRRQSAESFESNKKSRKQSKLALKRSEGKKVIRESILLACEGKITETLYFENIFSELKENHQIAASSLVIAKHQHTNPDGVLQDLLDHPNYRNFIHNWIVIDRDEERVNGGGHTLAQFNGALDRARIKGIQVAYSNPCLEIWFLLHFEYRNTAIDRDELAKKLEDDFDYQKNKLFQQGDINFAITNSKRLLDSHNGIPAQNNPSTTVHQLIEVLEKFKS